MGSSAPNVLISGRLAGELLKDHARNLGFDLAGVARAETPSSWPAFVEWLNAGYSGTMQYIPRRREAYRHPNSLLEGARCVMMLAMNYHAAPAVLSAGVTGRGDVVHTAGGPRRPNVLGRVAGYAQCGTDYHRVIRHRLAKLAAFARRLIPGSKARGVVDTAPLLERDFARKAGLGWFGKNTMLINKRLGSRFFLAALVLDVALENDLPFEKDHCGTCTACLEACPTQAFVAPRQLDARRCISYLTIEHAGAIDPALRPGMGNWLFGCDVCQDVCPWNRKAPSSSVEQLWPQAELQYLDAGALLRITESEFEARFSGTAMARPGRSGLRRNAAIVLGNSRDPQAAEELAEHLDDGDPIVRGAVAWALGRIGGNVARRALLHRREIETDSLVQAEILAALGCHARLTTTGGDV